MERAWQSFLRRRMSTLEALGFNVLIYSSVAVFSFAAFSVAVRCGFNAQLAPRTWARPRNVVRNVIRPPYGLMWIPWALNLRYVDMLEGIEGTGTRKQGWAGAKLKCNLDAIVLIKFHALCYKVSLLATFLCMVIVFPLNWTVGCNGDVVGNEVCAGMANLTNFENTTLAHIPPMGGCHSNQCASLSEENTENYDASWEDWSNVPERVQQSLDTYFLKAPGVTWRLFLIVVVAWCIYIYTCSEYFLLESAILSVTQNAHN